MSERNDLIDADKCITLLEATYGYMTAPEKLGARAAIRVANYQLAATIARLEAEVEAGKRERNATAARFARLHTIASKIRWADLGLPAMNDASTQEGLTELSQFLLQDALEESLDRQGLPRTEGERA